MGSIVMNIESRNMLRPGRLVEVEDFSHTYDSNGQPTGWTNRGDMGVIVELLNNRMCRVLVNGKLLILSDSNLQVIG